MAFEIIALMYLMDLTKSGHGIIKIGLLCIAIVSYSLLNQAIT